MRSQFQVVMLPSKEASKLSSPRAIYNIISDWNCSNYAFKKQLLSACNQLIYPYNTTKVNSIVEALEYLGFKKEAELYKDKYYIVEPAAPIQVNDWFVSLEDDRPTSLENMPYKCEDEVHSNNLFYQDQFVKVIASTDKSLVLPYPPQALIEAWVNYQDNVMINKFDINSDNSVKADWVVNISETK